MTTKTEPMPLAFLRDHLDLMRIDAQLRDINAEEKKELLKLTEMANEIVSKYNAQRATNWQKVADYITHKGLAPLGFKYDATARNRSSHALCFSKGVLYAEAVNPEKTGRSIIDMLFGFDKEPT